MKRAKDPTWANTKDDISDEEEVDADDDEGRYGKKVEAGLAQRASNGRTVTLCLLRRVWISASQR